MRAENSAGAHLFNAFVALALLFVFQPGRLAAERISPLGQRHDWSQLAAYSDTMTRAEFTRLLTTLYVPAGGWEAYVRLGDSSAFFVEDAAAPDRTVEVRFAAPATTPPAPKRYWHPAFPRTKPAQDSAPLAGVHIALDPGHLGGTWARMEERWFQIGNTTPITEGDLTLRVAELVAPRLEALGARISWVRRSNDPATPLRPEVLQEAARSSLQERGVTDIKPTYDGYADPLKDHSVQWEAEKLFYRLGEIRARAVRVNEELKPDLTLCLHFNAEEWGDPAQPALIEKSHLHMLVNGNYSAGELRYDDVRFEMFTRLFQRVHEEEIAAGESVAAALALGSGLPPYEYTDARAIRVRPGSRVWARNLLANRLYQSPVVYCEPYVMNSRQDFPRLQAGDFEGEREIGGKMQRSIFREYADAVAEGLAARYRSVP